ncbi:MAG: DNA polymerase I [Ruminococcaceae bacterium]|nr:DNA polymerase I [Oscillospiraceae bacterium]
MSKKILIIDGNSILNRAFYGIRILTNKAGLPTNAIYGMVNIILKHLENIRPDFAAVAFDLKAPTFRHKMFCEYKAGRHAMPDELAVQLPYAKRICELLGLKVLSLEGFEADDIIGTIAEYANNQKGLFSYVLTGDRDSLQLISENINVLLATNKDTLLFDTNTFFEKYRVTPDVFVDVKALMGDSSDNIPGVAGIGEKTALKLISDFGSLDEIYSNISDKRITNSLREKLENGKEAAYLSKALSKIKLDVPIITDIYEIAYSGFAKEELLTLFTELEFGALIKRLDLTSASTADSSELQASSVSESHVSLDQLITKLEECNYAAFTLTIDQNKIYAGISTDGKSNFITEITAEDTEKLIVNYSKKLIAYDTKALFKFFDIDPLTEFMFDIKLAAYVADSTIGKYEIERLALKYLSQSSANENDASLLYRLYTPLYNFLKEAGSLSVLFDIEQPLAGVLSDVEKQGVKIDSKGLSEFGRSLGIAADELAKRIYGYAGREFNINSPKQLGEVLFSDLALPFSKKTKTGYSTSAEVLEKLAPYYPIVRDILDYRQIVKLKSTYTDALVALADEDGLIHTSFNQTITATGRLSSTEPNLQNIPIRTELGHELRKYFIPRKDSNVFIDADYSQIELRLLAEISNDENMINAFLSGVDIHTSTAAQVFSVGINDVTPELRKRAKAVNFGIVYGIGDYSLSQDLGVTKKEAAEYIDGYKKNYPGIRKYLENIVAEAYDNGYVTTKFGRRRYISELSESKSMLKKFGERVAMNSPIQGTAADIIKIAMINTYKRLKNAGINAKLILQVHDELVIEADESVADKAAQILKHEMENVAAFKVPLISEVSIGRNWFECK